MNSEIIMTAIACITFIGSGIATIVHLTAEFKDAVIKIKEEFEASLLNIKKETEQAIQLKDAEFSGKLGKMWERFDVHKTFCDNTFVRGQTCAMVHDGAEKAINTLSNSFEKSSGDMSRRMENMETKIDGLIVALLERK
jgi:hypothetical protein